MNAFNRTLTSRALMIYLPFFRKGTCFLVLFMQYEDMAGREATQRREKGKQTGAVSRKHESEKSRREFFYLG